MLSVSYGIAEFSALLTWKVMGDTQINFYAVTLFCDKQLLLNLTTTLMETSIHPLSYMINCSITITASDCVGNENFTEVHISEGIATLHVCLGFISELF